jgi:hypothetical protein
MSPEQPAAAQAQNKMQASSSLLPKGNLKMGQSQSLLTLPCSPSAPTLAPQPDMTPSPPSQWLSHLFYQIPDTLNEMRDTNYVFSFANRPPIVYISPLASIKDRN